MNLTKKKIRKPKSIFGTARLGMQEYGYPKKSYLNDRKSLIEDIIDLGVDTFDTAPSYGDAENIIEIKPYKEFVSDFLTCKKSINQVSGDIIIDVIDNL